MNVKSSCKDISMGFQSTVFENKRTFIKKAVAYNYSDAQQARQEGINYIVMGDFSLWQILAEVFLGLIKIKFWAWALKN